MTVVQVTPQDHVRIEGFEAQVYVDIDSSRGYGLGVVFHRFCVDENKRKPAYLLRKDSSFMLWMPSDKEEKCPEWWGDADVVWFWEYSYAGGE